jgi:hypothetical protein
MTVRYFVLPATVASALGAFSVSVDAAVLVANVPFNFTVRSQAFARGRCTVSTGRDPQGVVFVRGAAAGAFASVNPLRAAGEVDPKLVFYKYGDEYVLRELWLGNGMGLRLPESAVERKLRENARSRKVVLMFERVAVPAL